MPTPEHVAEVVIRSGGTSRRFRVVAIPGLGLHGPSGNVIVGAVRQVLAALGRITK
jgi:hypothetical protein